MSRKSLPGCAGGGVAAIVLLYWAPALTARADTSGTQSDSSAGLAEVVVTAQRREESVQHTPVAVTAFTAAEIEARGIRSTNDIGANVPGVETVRSTGTISEGDYTIRGIGQDSLSITFDPGVGFYIDDVYIARTSFSARDIFDLDRVEVLRGPQGTLYGRNSSGGAIKLYTKQPDQDLSLDVEGSYGNYDVYTVQAAGNLPLTPVAALRVTASRSAEDEGYLIDPALGQRVGTHESDYFHGVLRLDPTDQLDIRFSSDLNRLTSDGLNFSDPNDQPFVNSSGLYQSGTAYSNNVLNYSQTPLHLYDDATEYGVSADIRYKLDGGAELRSITAYRHNDVQLELDLNNTGLALQVNTDGHQFTEELQLEGAALAGRLKYLGGFFYFNENAEQDWIVGLPLADQYFQSTHSTLLTNSESVYTQETYSILDSLRLTAGIRFTHEEKTLGVNSPLGATPYSTATLIAVGLPDSISANKVTPKIAVEKDVGDNVLTYASYAKGYKGGGFNATSGDPRDATPFAAEQVNAYEVGEKSQWFDNRWRVNTALFVSKLSDAQLNYLSLAGTGNLIEGNVASATIEGVELESSARLTTAWSLFGYVDYTANKIDSVTASALAANIRPGNQLKDTPKWKYQTGSAYTDSLGSLPGNFTLRGTWTWTGKSTNSPTDDPIQAVPAHGELDLRARYDSAGLRWYVQLEGDNVTDVRYPYARLNVLPSVPAQGNMPALYRIRVGYKFF